MKILLRKSTAVIAAAAIFAVCVVFAYAGIPVLPKDGYINDTEQVISEETAAAVNASVNEMAQINGSRIFVLTVAQPGTISEYAERVFTEWELTSLDSLLVITMTNSNYYLYCGGDVAAAITAPGMKVLLANSMEEPFSEGRLDDALTATVAALRGFQDNVQPQDARNSAFVNVLLVVLIVLLTAAALFIIFILALRARNKRIRAARRRRMAAARRKPQPARRPARTGRYNIIEIPRDDDGEEFISAADRSDDDLIL